MNQIYNFSLEQVVNERIASFMENLILLASESQFAAAVCQEYSLFIVPIKIFVEKNIEKIFFSQSETVIQKILYTH
jgi:hypothetical protein